MQYDPAGMASLFYVILAEQFDGAISRILSESYALIKEKKCTT